MFLLNTNIQIGDFEFPYCVEVEIVSSIDSLTDTCKITIPRKIEWDGKKIALGDDPVLKRRDKVIVKAGYDGDYKTQFIGYVKSIKPGVPVTIECEDSMMLLKHKELTKSYLKLTLNQLLTDIVPEGIKFICNDIFLGDYRFTKVSAAKVLEDLRTRYGIFSSFRLITDNNITEPVLYVGFAYWEDHKNEEVFEFGYNIINSDDLIYEVADELELKVKAIGIQKDNKRIELEVGDPDGELRTVYRYNVDAATLKQFALAELERFKYTGYRGNFLTFGEPSVQKGDVVNLVGNKYHPDTKHRVMKVTKQIGFTRGYKQVIEPRELA